MDNAALEQRRKEQLLLDSYYHYDVHQTKTNLEIANEKVAGRVLTNLFKTTGSPNPFKPSHPFFELLLEIDGKDIYRFTDCYLEKWVDNEAIEAIAMLPVSVESGAVFRNQRIKEIWQTQYGEWTLELANGIIIEPRSDGGTSVWIGKKEY
jgi:hypothetical protein